MDNDIQRVLDKQQADRKKQEIKRLLKQIDASEKTGFVKIEIFV
jgi:2,3-bisphosphoglycerate-independent phosphoglycerate mutase